MALPPFPCQDLAKLVLGYLDDEDLMSVYDEFLHESPYLDASSNEFDRVVFTSLKSILAEYRAVRIFLSSCKPNLLRRRLKSCPNLVEAFKVLVELADVTKLSPESRMKPRYEDHLQRQQHPASDTGNSTDLQWQCKSRLSQLSRIEHEQDHSMETSVETASPNDLPGNFGTTKKRKMKTLERERDIYNHQQTPQSYDDLQFTRTTNIHNECNVGMSEPNATRLHQASNIQLNINSRSNDHSTSYGGNAPERLHQSNTNSTRDSGKAVAGDTFNTDLPDGNTSRHTNVVYTSAENTGNIITSSTNAVKATTKTNFQSKYGSIPNKSPFPSTYPGKIKPKSSDQKIMILSDVKVDKPLTDGSSMMTEILRKAPEMQMKTILINGTPAFRQCDTLNYTEDEIMAMPTFIVVANTSSETAPTPTIQTAVPKTNTTMTSATPLGPLLIDICNQTGNENKEESKPPDPTFNNPSDNAILLKTVQGKNFSLPKDNVITTVGSNKSTPQIVPPVRKSSSTPRRNSHIRVLDFATPRRILEDTIDEQDDVSNSQNTNEVIVSRSPSLQTFVEAASAGKDKTNPEIQETQNASVGSTKDDNENNPKKNNWDADLRALAVANNDGFVKTIPLCQQRRKKATNKKDHKSSDKKKTPKSKKRKSDEVIVIPASPAKDVTDTAVVKPTINIVTSSDWAIPDTKQTQSEHNKSNEEPTETPELDKTSLQNVIGSKLNISDLLETPYKQALYDIQMETPRFLDFPGEPPSDIKITSIPTPRFMDTPKPPQATPSYSSRGTDYSSGGSYYKPDDQDCLALDTLGYLQKVTDKHKQSEEQLDDTESKSGVRSRRSSTRPIRKCAKNVTYRNTPPIKTSKERKSSHKFEDKNETLSSCSDTNYSDYETQHESKKTQSSKTKRQSDATSRSRSRKSPAKKQTPKSFMKIKPRRPNPSKDSARKTKRKTPESRKRTSSKENSGKVIAIVCKSTNRRKSSTPRKLDANSYPLDSPDHVDTDNNPFTQNTLDKPIRYPDSEAQNDSSEKQARNRSLNESDDISKIKEFIAISETKHTQVVERSLQADLVNRGFDEVTAKIIERDLLDTPRHPSSSDVVRDTVLMREEPNKTEPPLEMTLESSSASNNLQIVQDEDDDDDEFTEWSVHECNEQTTNHTSCNYDETQQIAKAPPITIKDNYSMEVCFEDRDVKLKLMQLTSFVDMNPDDTNPSALEYIDYSYRETESAVSSISNIDKLYTPLKDSIKAACQEIFDSTLTSLDTPLKATSPKIIEHETAVAEIVLEVEKVDDSGKQTKKKRRRISSDGSAEETKEGDTKKIKRGTSVSSDDTGNDNKTKPETPYLLNTENIQKIDIESVLCRLHGP